MKKSSNNRLHPLFILKTINGVIINEFCEEKILANYLENKDTKTLKTGTIITYENVKYSIENINIEYSTNMHGDYGTPINYEGEYDNYNLVINIILNSKNGN